MISLDRPTMLVSVLMTAYNAERYLPLAIDSVLRQTLRDFEFLIINDGSTDQTQSIIDDYARRDPRIRTVSHANMGMGKSLNKGLELVRGEWVARFDADDEMLPTRLQRQVEFVREHPDVAVTATLVNYIDRTGRIIGRSRSDLLSKEALERALRKGEVIHVHHPAVMARPEVLRAVGGFRSEFWPADDVDLWNRVADAGHLIVVQPEHLTHYRIHGSSACVESSRRATRKLEWVEACARRRRAGRLEPTWAEFLDERSRSAPAARLNRFRKDVARTCYKAATLHYSDRRYHRFLPAIAAAAVLEPKYVLSKLLPQLLPHKTA
jgi:glycosyltransferase involved in cell wall biosynthesis